MRPHSGPRLAPNHSASQRQSPEHTSPPGAALQATLHSFKGAHDPCLALGALAWVPTCLLFLIGQVALSKGPVGHGY